MPTSDGSPHIERDHMGKQGLNHRAHGKYQVNASLHFPLITVDSVRRTSYIRVSELNRMQQKAHLASSGWGRCMGTWDQIRANLEAKPAGPGFSCSIRWLFLALIPLTVHLIFFCHSPDLSMHHQSWLKRKRHKLLPNRTLSFVGHVYRALNDRPISAWLPCFNSRWTWKCLVIWKCLQKNPRWVIF